MNQRELKKLIKLCKSEGVQYFEWNGVKLVFDKKAIQVKKEVKEELSDPTSKFTDEDMLFWSSTGVQE